MGKGTGWPRDTELYSAVVADALDRLGCRFQTMHPTVRRLTGQSTLVGRVLAVAIEASDIIEQDDPYGDWIAVMERVELNQVLVLGVAKGVYAATWGELFSYAALGRGAIGVVTDGYVRDIDRIRAWDFPVFCRGGSPLDTLGRARVAEVGGEVTCGGVRVGSDDFVVADEDGVVVVPQAAVPEVDRIVTEKVRLESGSREALLAGISVRDVWNDFGVF